MEIKEEPLAPRPARKKEPCRKQQIDFHLCDKKYGFNDLYCKRMSFTIQIILICTKPVSEKTKTTMSRFDLNSFLIDITKMQSIL
jgi:hypothetical protein